MATYDAGAYPASDEDDGCEFHESGLRLVTALFARLYEVEQRVEAIEQRDRDKVEARPIGR